MSSSRAGARRRPAAHGTQILEELSGTSGLRLSRIVCSTAHTHCRHSDVTKVAFIAGGRRGSGAMVVRDKNGHFSNPVFVALTGGSFGWQAGVQSTDVVLVFTNAHRRRGHYGRESHLGADASVAAGPVGRQASIATDSNFNAEVYSYSRNLRVICRHCPRRQRPVNRPHCQCRSSIKSPA